MAIVAGLNTSSISRLKFTQSAAKQAVKTLKSLENRLSALGSYKDYRNMLKNFDPPLIPYIGVYIQDLTFIEDGNPDEIDDYINFHKRVLIYRGKYLIQTNNSH